MATHRVRILSTDELRIKLLQKECKYPLVVPGYLFLERNDSVEFFSKESEAIVSFPDEKGPFLENAPIRLAAGQKKTLPIAKNVEPDEVYPYSVFVIEDNEYAEANSSPKIIIE